jgi:hypothetical protein
MPAATTVRSCKLPNALASLVMSGAIGLAYFNCDPMIAGSEPPRRMAALGAQPVLALPPLPQARVPAPAEPGDVAPGSHSPATVAAEVSSDGVLRGPWALQVNSMLLERGIEKFRQIPSYKFTLTRRERVGGDLLPPQVMDVKLRHSPFSLYMKWIEGEGPGVKGRQLLFVEGANENKLVILPGGLLGRVSGAVTLSLDDPMVTAEARHPANECGLLHLAETLLHHHRLDLEAGCQGVHCELHDHQVCNDRPCYLFVGTYESQERSPTYRKVAIYIDKELSMPIAIQNYTWADNVAPEELDAVTLVEAYSYSDIVADTRQAGLTEDDFSRDNPKYRMKTR